MHIQNRIVRRRLYLHVHVVYCQEYILHTCKLRNLGFLLPTAVLSLVLPTSTVCITR